MSEWQKGTNGGPYLQGLVGSLTGRRLALEGRQVLGRDAAECQLVLAQAVVSRRHAEFETDGLGRVVVTDLGSRQGTFVNGQRVERRELNDGDRVGFGPEGIVAFTFRAGSAAPTAGPPAPTAEPGSRAEALRAQFMAAAQVAAGGSPAGTAAPPVPPAPPTPSRTAAPPPAAAPPRRAEKVVLNIGRAGDNDIVLEAPGVSRHHAALDYGGGAQPVLSDLGSTNGTFVNGQPLTEPRRLAPHDLVFLGGFLLRVQGREVKRHDLSASRITARDITKEIDGRPILRGISLALFPREFVGLMGPSGCGKSTLMDALNGLRPASSGSVHVNDLDLYRNFDALRRSIGYVPQHDVLHDVLTVERTLYYAAKLRLPDGTPSAELRRIVGEVIATVGLEEHRDAPFRRLSGGQQKRLSLAVELITKPNFIFLDEPTSPLDPETTENMMMLFRRLADEGRIVVMVTHKFEKFEEMHHVAILTKGGRLAYFGPPREALAYFGCREPGEIYRRIGARDPDELAREFRSSPHYRRYVSDRIAETEELTRTSGQTPLLAGAPAAAGGAERRFGIRQWLTLTRRYLDIKLKDRRNTALLLAQAPFIAAILALITNSVNDAKTIFIAAVIAIWFGANNAVREIVAEVPIYTRERLVNLKIPSYVFSKFAVLSGVGLIQVLLFVGILVGFGRLSGEDFWRLTLVLYLTLLAGVSMGLLFSAAVSSTEKAMSVLPLILIPQLLLGGFLMPLEDLYRNARTGRPASVADYERFEEAKDRPPAGPRAAAVPPDPVQKFDGLGAARYAADAMIARWSIEALAHTVSIHDTEARDRLPASMTVRAYQKVFDGEDEETIGAAYRRRVLLDALALAAFSGLFLLLTMWALRRKDVL
ncbi:MAG TPA: FHA domain-containing protein [Pyrinomonadaceae bacterium]|nr:FHA domain-containing protein [Pyrinomonadaceae bacterium]